MRGLARERESGGRGNFGMAWLLLCLAFCAHVADEALTGFLPVYDATVLAMRSQYKWFPMPAFGSRVLTADHAKTFGNDSRLRQTRNPNAGIGNHLYWLRIASTVAS